MPEATATIPRKRPKQSRSRATVAAIVEATARVLIDVGYDRLTTTRVAEVAGVSVGSLYQYFSCKEELAAALLEQKLGDVQAQLLAAGASHAESALPVLVRALVRAVLQTKAAEPELHTALKTEISRDVSHPIVSELNDRVIELVVVLLERHRDQIAHDDLRLCAFTMVHAVEGVIEAALADSPVPLGDSRLEDAVVALAMGFLERRDTSMS